jgi:hypothetical protein
VTQLIVNSPVRRKRANANIYRTCSLHTGTAKLPSFIKINVGVIVPCQFSSLKEHNFI